MGVWAEQGPNLPLQAGDEIRLWFKTVGITYATAAQIALIERRLEKDKRFRVRSHSMPQKDGWFQSFYYQIRIVDPAAQSATGQVQEAGIISAMMIIGVIAAAAMGVAWLTNVRTEKMIELREVELEIVKAGGDIPFGGVGGTVQSTGNAIWKIAGAFVLAVAAWRLIE